MAKNLQETKQRNRAAMSQANGTAGTSAGYNGAGGAGAYEFGGEFAAGVEGVGSTGVTQSKKQNKRAMNNAMASGAGMSKSK